MPVRVCAYMQVPLGAGGPPEVIGGYKLPDVGAGGVNLDPLQ